LFEGLKPWVRSFELDGLFVEKHAAAREAKKDFQYSCVVSINEFMIRLIVV
jgi:hypothetical protein